MLLSSRISSLLKIAAMLLGFLPCVSVLSAQEPLQFNVPYRCSDGITYIVHRCEPKGHGEVCFWREEKNGQLVTEAYSVRGQTASRVQACRVESGTPAGQPTSRQALNPPYLNEMPLVDRVLREMQANDAAETAARQMGTFLQMKKIIENIAGPRLYHNQLTPDETRLIGEYYAANSRIAQSRPEYAKFPALKGYDISPKFRNELFQRFFSPAVRAEYEKVDAAFAAQHQARVQADNQALETAKAQAAAAQAQQAEKAKDQQAIARCIGAGRSEFDCIGETMKKELGGMLGAVDPSLKQVFTTAPGLRVSGLYGASGFALVFPQDQDPQLPDYVSLACGELVMEAHSYTVVNTGNQVIVKIDSVPKALVLAFNPDGNLTGPGPIDVKGKVVIGSTQQWVTSVDSYGIAYGHNATVPVYQEKIEHCNAGTLAVKGAAPDLSPMSALTSLAILRQSEKATTGSKDFKVPPGLRLIGDYAGQSGFTVEFRRESATLGCGQAVAAHSYSIQTTGKQVLAKIGDDGSPIVLTLLADGKLSGSGQVHISGRALTGIQQDPMAASKDKLVFAPTSANCNVGTLALTTDSTPREFEAGAAAARASLHPAGPIPTATPVNASASASAAGAGGNAVLSLINGFPTGPGVPNALAGKSLVLLKQSFESALTKSGLQPAPGMTVIQSWAAACNKGAPECQQGAAAGVQFKVAGTKMDLDGRAQFSGLPAGAYYLFGFTQYNSHHLVWNLKVELRPGANSITLNENNAVTVD